jgi:hypothetical protein
MILNATRGYSRLVGNFSREEPLECHATSTGPTQPLPRGGGWIADLAVIAAISFAALCLAWQAGSGLFRPGLCGGNGTCGIRRAQPLAMNDRESTLLGIGTALTKLRWLSGGGVSPSATALMRGRHRTRTFQGASGT